MREHCTSLYFAVLRPNNDNDNMTNIMIKYDESVIGLLIYKKNSGNNIRPKFNQLGDKI